MPFITSSFNVDLQVFFLVQFVSREKLNIIFCMTAVAFRPANDIAVTVLCQQKGKFKRLTYKNFPFRVGDVCINKRLSTND